MCGIATAESKKSPKSQKVLAHLEIHPQLGGGHIVKHVYSGYHHEPKEVKFNEDGKSRGGEHIVAHLAKHAGLSAMQSADGGNGSEAVQED